MGINGQRKDQWLQLDLGRCESSIWSSQTLLLKVNGVDSLLLCCVVVVVCFSSEDEGM